MLYLIGLSEAERDAQLLAAVAAGTPIDPAEYEAQFDLNDVSI